VLHAFNKFIYAAAENSAMKRIMQASFGYWGFGFWCGVAVISLINIIKISLSRNSLSYDWWMLGISLVIIAVYLVLRWTKVLRWEGRA
jgi:hypothetical protein